MNEKIYTIPVNEAFEKQCGCPICTLARDLEQKEIDGIMGAAMMEPDIRIQTNRRGFCQKHFEQMLHIKNRLSLTLILESHLEEIYQRALAEKALPDGKQAAREGIPALSELEESCYVCALIENYLDKMLSTVFYLWKNDPAFIAKVKSQPYFCLPHLNAQMCIRDRPGDYQGQMLFFFENGKCARVPLTSYQVKGNRRKLTGAYAAKTPLVALYDITAGTLFTLITTNGKHLIVHSDLIPLKTTRSSIGVAVMSLRGNNKLHQALVFQDGDFVEPHKYMAKNIPAAGSFLSKKDREKDQIGLGGESGRL